MSLKIANKCLRDGFYCEAINHYRAILNKLPDLSETILFNIDMCERRIRLSSMDSAERNQSPLVSVIIPSHNVDKYIDKCLNSVRSQTLEQLEIIVIDDGSNDSTVEKILMHCEDDNRVILIRNERESGNSGTPRNQGIKYCSGEYVSFVDSDDWIDPEMLVDMYEKAKSTGSDIISSSGFYRENSGGSVETVATKYNGLLRDDARLRKELFLSQHFPIAWFRLYKRTFLLKNHLHFGETKTSSDLPFSFKALFFANKIDVVDGIYYHYRFNRPGSTIDRRKGKESFQLFTAYRNIIDFLNKNNAFEEYIPFLTLKALGDYTYNLKFINESLKNEFRCAMSNFVKDIYEAVKSSEVLSDNWKKLLKNLNNEAPSNLSSFNSLYSETNNEELPKLSIIVPANNVLDYIEFSCNSILKQTLADFELIVVDDGSTDGTGEYLDQLSRSDNRVCLIKCNKPSGNPSSPRNIGLARARGQYIGFVDSDDWVERDMFMELLSAAINSEADIASASHFYRHDEVSCDLIKINYKTIESKNDRARSLSSGYFSNVWNRIYKREFIFGNDIYFPKMYVSEDFCFSAMSHALANKTTCAKGGWYHYRYNRNGSTTNKRKGVAGIESIDYIQTMNCYFRSFSFDESLHKYIIKKMIDSLLYTFKRIDKSLSDMFILRLRSCKNHFAHHFDPWLWESDDRELIFKIFPDLKG